MWNRSTRGRGRPLGDYYSLSDLKLLKYLALISVKYEVDSDKLFDEIVNASIQKKSVCNELIIKCRTGFDGENVFIITKNEKVITQFRMSAHLLQEKNPIKEFVSSIHLPPRYSRESNPDPTSINDLKAGMKRVHVRAEILKLPETREVLTRFGSYARLTNAIIGDATGSIKLALWNKQIDLVSLGDRIAIDNAKVVWFRGEPQLRIGRKGELKVVSISDDLS